MVIVHFSITADGLFFELVTLGRAIRWSSDPRLAVGDGHIKALNSWSQQH